MKNPLENYMLILHEDSASSTPNWPLLCTNLKILAQRIREQVKSKPVPASRLPWTESLLNGNQEVELLQKTFKRE